MLIGITLKTSMNIIIWEWCIFSSENAWKSVEVLNCPELVMAYEDSFKCESSDKKRKLSDMEMVSSEPAVKKIAHVSILLFNFNYFSPFCTVYNCTI